MVRKLVFVVVAAILLAAAGYAVWRNPGDWWLAVLAAAIALWVVRTPIPVAARHQRASVEPVTKSLEAPDPAAQSRFIRAVPALASLDITRSLDFFCEQLGFTRGYCQQGEYGIAHRDGVEVHFWACADPAIPKATSCRIEMQGVGAFYQVLLRKGLIHPKEIGRAHV